MTDDKRLAGAVRNLKAVREDAKESAAEWRGKIQLAEAEVAMIAEEILDGQAKLFTDTKAA